MNRLRGVVTVRMRVCVCV